MTAKVIIADPNQKTTHQAISCLEHNDYEVNVALNGKDLQLKTYKERYFAAILDLDTQEHSAMEVLKYLKTTKAYIKIILTVDGKNRLEELDLSKEDLIKLGASDILIKPYNDDQLLRSLRGQLQFDLCRNKEKESHKEHLDQEVTARDDLFTKIHINEFLSGNSTIVDIYIRIGPHKYIKILNQGDYLPIDRINKYQVEKNIDYLYFKTRDRAMYMHYLNQILKKTLAHPNKNLGKKVKALKTSTELYLQEIHTAGLQPQLVEEGKQVCENINNIIKQDKGLFELMNKLKDTDFSIYTHSFLVSFLSAVCCRNLEWNSKQTIEKISMGGILHDIGKLKIDPQISKVLPSKLNAKQVETLMMHPEIGVEMVSKFNTVTPEIKQIIYQHHETMDGSGYPNHLTGIKIYPLAQIVGFIDYLAIIMAEKNISPAGAFKIFLSDPNNLQKYSTKIVKAFAQSLID